MSKSSSKPPIIYSFFKESDFYLQLNVFNVFTSGLRSSPYFSWYCDFISGCIDS